MNAYVEPMFQCAFHPSEGIVGVCSSCLRERLLNLAKTIYEQRRWEIVYTPDPASWGYLTEIRKNNDVYTSPSGIRDRYLDAARNSRPMEKKMHLPARPPFQNCTNEKKTRKKFSGLRSLFGFMKKKDIKEEFQADEDQPQDCFEYESTERSGRSSWIASVVALSGKTAKEKYSCSARQSVSEHRSTARPSWEGIVLRRSTSNFEKRIDVENTRMHEDCRRRCSDSEQDLKCFSDSFTRNQTFELYKNIRPCRMREGVVKSSNHEQGKMFPEDAKYNIPLNSESWSWRLNYSGNHLQRSCQSGKAWVNRWSNPIQGKFFE
eukprot:Gb_00040 [translate_table: standard]